MSPASRERSGTSVLAGLIAIASMACDGHGPTSLGPASPAPQPAPGPGSGGSPPPQAAPGPAPGRPEPEPAPVEWRVVPTVLTVLDWDAARGRDVAERTAVVTALRAVGVASVVTTAVPSSAAAPLVVLAGNVHAGEMPPATLAALEGYVLTGGRLVSGPVEDPLVARRLFGVEPVGASRQRRGLTLDVASAPDLFRRHDRPQEQAVPFAAAYYPDAFWTFAVSPREARRLASFDDGAAALTLHALGRGEAFQLGVRLSDVVLRPFLDRDFEPERGDDLTFEPAADVFLLLLAALHERAARFGVRVANAPWGRAGVVLVTHDVDAQPSFANTVAYEALGHDLGLRPTFFVTTKTVTDHQDAGYFADPTKRAFVDALRDVHSHSVSHATDFHLFELGPPWRPGQAYEPYFDGTRTLSGTIRGEVNASRERLAATGGGRVVTGFRAGYLRHPPLLPDALEEAGYAFDSSFAGFETLSSHVWELRRGLALDGAGSGVLELPVTISDYHLRTAADEDRVLGCWQAVTAAHADNDAVVTLLVHPDVTDFKLSAERRLLTWARARGLHLSGMTDYVAHWRRSRASSFACEEARVDGVVHLRVRVPDLSALPAGLTLRAVDPGRELGAATFVDHAGRVAAATLVRRGDELLLVFGL